MLDLAGDVEGPATEVEVEMGAGGAEFAVGARAGRLSSELHFRDAAAGSLWR